MMKRRRSSALAAIFDAMLFLAVVTVAAAVLLSGMQPGARQDDPDLRRLERAHAVLLASTLPDGKGANVTVMELAAESIRGSNATAALEFASGSLPVLLPGMQHRWSVRWDGRAASTGPEPPGGTPVYCVTASVAMPWGEVSFALTAWRA